MRIGILTFHRSVNNGAVMQCYALSQRLRQDFPNDEVEVIDYQMRKVEQAYSGSISAYFRGCSPMLFLKKAVRLLREPDKLRKARKRTAVFKGALNKLPLSPKTILDDGTQELIQYINDRYDVLVVGSDAVWNYVTRGFPNAYFPDERVKCRKLSYAASCYGMDFLNCPEADRQGIGQSLRNFDFLGVRDEATEQFVAWSGAGKTPVHTCDPTAFLQVDKLPVDEDALKKKLRDRGFDFSRPTIGVMGTEKMVRMVREFYGSRYQIAALYNATMGADVQLFDLEPYEWAYVFRYFKLTFTTFFHGTMLSLRNGVPVICIALKTEFARRHTPKTLDVLTRLGYEDWYFETDYVAQNLDAIKATADKLLTASVGEQILERMNREAESYEAFRSALARCVDTAEENDHSVTDETI